MFYAKRDVIIRVSLIISLTFTIAFYILYTTKYIPHSEPTTGVMTITSLGRLGNNMMEFAALLALAQTNKCRPVISPKMATYLKPCFPVSVPVGNKNEFTGQWNSYYLAHTSKDEYDSLPCLKNMNIQLTGYPSDWNYFRNYEDNVRSEFRFTKFIQQKADNFYSQINVKRNVTYVGVHVRRTDYGPYLQRQSCHLADANYLRKAMQKMLSKYPDVVFVIASDDVIWCEQMLEEFKNVSFFVSQNFSPCLTMAILARCDHSVITQGTFGFWSAYLAGGQTIFYDNYCNNDTSVLEKFEGLRHPNWTSISAKFLH